MTQDVSSVPQKHVFMPFNLLTDLSFPVVTSRGDRKWISYADLAVVDSDDGYPVEFGWPRADFNIAAFEFAIGVATLAFRPLRRTDWLKLWNSPPQPDDVRAALAPFAHAFELDGDGPRFMQELGGLDGEAKPIEALLIDTPGDNGQQKNADLLTHRARYHALGMPAAAMALYTLQQFAPSGGAGNRTSMRGGGPLTTLVLPGGEKGITAPIWRTILANVVEDAHNEIDDKDLAKILPWLAPTIISDKAHGERAVAEVDPDVHPLQTFFGMPRRMALRIAGSGPCPMTGAEGALVDAFRQKPWGTNYGLWRHPLTPYRQQKEGAEPYSVKPKSGRFGFRDWTAVVVGEKVGVLAHPAKSMSAARHERRRLLRGDGGADARIRVGGWAMNNMEAITYLAAEEPLHLAASDEAQDALDLSALRFARAAEPVASMLIFALRAALFSKGAKPATDKGVFEDARAAFFEASEDAFHAALDSLLETPEGVDETRARHWLRVLTRVAFATFDAVAPIPIDDAGRARRIAEAFRSLRLALAGYGKQGNALFTILELPLPEPASSKRGKQNGR
jgi:CRISPR system Cascade subunit CasA